MIKNIILACLLLISLCGETLAQTSDDKFRQPLKDVLTDIQNRYGIAIRYPADLIKDRWVNYAQWRYRPNVEETLTNILASQDLTFAKEGDKRYKIQDFQYHLKTVKEGQEQLGYLSSLYKDVQGWQLRKDSLNKCFLSALRLTKIPVRPSSQPISTPVRKFKDYTVQNIALETMPGVYVCGSFYRPVKYKGKIPVVLNPDGHFSKGRYREDCQYRCAALAKMGAMAFSYDLFGWEG